MDGEISLQEQLIAERKLRERAEMLLAENENRFRRMADASPVLIWMAGPDRGWQFCNRRWLDFTGLDIDQVQGTGWTDAVHPDDLTRVLEHYTAALDAREEITLDFRLRRHDDEYRWITTRAVPMSDGQGGLAGMIGSGLDITDLRMTEERLRHSAKLESLGILAGGIAHDFNNLLTGILGNASLALEELPPESGATALIENIVQAGETAAQLTRQMLAYSGKGRFVLEPVDLSGEVREIIPLLRASIPRTVQVRMDLARQLPMVEADPGQIQQLVMNLVINGAEAIGVPSVGMVSVATELTEVDTAMSAAMVPGFTVAPGHYVALRVRDNGQGMDKETAARIFDPFFTTKFTGRGLGLAAVAGILRGHNAGLLLASERGRGTEFHIFFPAVGIEDVMSASEPEMQRANTGSGTVLVVDDELIVTRTARLTLQKYGYTVLTAQNGREALELFNALMPEIDLVLIDMTMPVMPSDAAVREIRSLRPDIKVIATSGYSEAEVNERFGGAYDAFVQKPYKAAELAAKVHEVITRRG